MVCTRVRGLRSQSGLGESVFDQGRVKACDVTGDVLGCAQSGLAAALLPGQRRDGLLDQSGFPVRGRLDDPQVARLDAVLAELAPQTGGRKASALRKTWRGG